MSVGHAPAEVLVEDVDAVVSLHVRRIGDAVGAVQHVAVRRAPVIQRRLALVRLHLSEPVDVVLTRIDRVRTVQRVVVLKNNKKELSFHAN